MFRYLLDKENQMTFDDEEEEESMMDQGGDFDTRSNYSDNSDKTSMVSFVKTNDK